MSCFTNINVVPSIQPMSETHNKIRDIFIKLNKINTNKKILTNLIKNDNKSLYTNGLRLFINFEQIIIQINGYCK